MTDGSKWKAHFSRSRKWSVEPSCRWCAAVKSSVHRLLYVHRCPPVMFSWCLKAALSTTSRWVHGGHQPFINLLLIPHYSLSNKPPQWHGVYASWRSSFYGWKKSLYSLFTFLSPSWEHVNTFCSGCYMITLRRFSTFGNLSLRKARVTQLN